jgi:hypothetical protein
LIEGIEVLQQTIGCLNL